MKLRAAALLLIIVGGCRSALHEPKPVVAGLGVAQGRDVDALLAEADAAWARRADPTLARRADQLYTAAAAVAPARVEGLLGAMRAKAFIIEREPSAQARNELARAEVDEGQWCLRRAPGDAACSYALAIALGQFARENHRSAEDAMKRMVALLQDVIKRAPELDGAGPRRVLALLYLRAPGWPLGPGDPEAGLDEARAAMALAPERPDNELVLAEALAKNGQHDEARAAFTRALAAAERAQAAGDPDGSRWVAEARAGLGSG